jgi:hypothetical protein
MVTDCVVALINVDRNAEVVAVSSICQRSQVLVDPSVDSINAIPPPGGRLHDLIEMADFDSVVDNSTIDCMYRGVVDSSHLQAGSGEADEEGNRNDGGGELHFDDLQVKKVCFV